MNKAISWLCKIFLGPVIKNLFIKEITGLDNIPKTNFILAANHQSHLDELIAGYICLPRRFRFIGQTDNYSGLKKIVLYILYFIAGVIRLNRKDEKSKKGVVEKAIKYLKGGDILIIYPEGTRSRTGEIGKGKLGIAKIFLETGKPILLMAIGGTFKLLPPGGKLKIKKIVKVNIGYPLYFRELYLRSQVIAKESKEYGELLIKITESIMKEIRKLKVEID